MTYEEREKDYLKKLQILKSALINEKQKTTTLDLELKNQRKLNSELESEIEKKDKDIIKHTSEKHNLISQLDFYRYKKLKQGEYIPEINNESYDFSIEEMSDNLKKRNETLLKSKVYPNSNNNSNTNRSFEDKKVVQFKNYNNNINENTPESNKGDISPLTNNNQSNKDDSIKVKDSYNNIKSNINTFIKGMFTPEKDLKDQNNTCNLVKTNPTNSNRKLSNNSNNTHNSNYTYNNNNNNINNTRNFNFKNFSDDDLIAKQQQDLIEQNNNLSSNLVNYELLVNNLTIQNQNLKNLLSESNSNIRKVKEEFQTIILAQMEKLNSLESELKIAREELLNSTQSTVTIINQNKLYEVKSNNYESQIKKLNIDLAACQDTIKKFQKIIDQKESLILQLNDNIKKYENENIALAKKMTALKNAILDENIKETIYTGYKKDMFSKSNYEITFAKTEDNLYVLNLKNEKYSKENDLVSIEDIESLKQSSDYEGAIEIKYVKDKKIKSLILFINENISSVLKTYKDFREKALSVTGNIV